MSGSKSLSLDGGTTTVHFEADLYFPEGRKPNAPVMLVHQDPYIHDLSIWRGTLGPNSEATDLHVGDHCSNWVSGDLLGPTGGILGEVHNNLNGPGTDVIAPVTATMLLCKSGDTPAPELSAQSKILPTGPLWLYSATPLDPASRQPTTLPGMPSPLALGESNGRLFINPSSGSFAPGQHTLDLSFLRDVMSRPMAGDASFTVLQPAGMMNDPSLATVDEDAVALLAGDIVQQPGVLRLSASNASEGLGAVVGLGGTSSDTSLRVRQRFVCEGSVTANPNARVQVVASDGSSSPVPYICGSTPQDQVVQLVGPAPWYLVVDELRATMLPCRFPEMYGANDWELDEFEFSP